MAGEHVSPTVEQINQQVNDLLDTGPVEVDGSKQRWLWLPADAFRQWKDIPHVTVYAASNSELSDYTLRVKVSSQSPGIAVEEKKLLGILPRKKIMDTQGFHAVEVFAHARHITYSLHTPQIRWEYELVVPDDEQPFLRVLEDELRYKSHPIGEYEPAGTYIERFTPTPSTLEAFTVFLANVRER